MNIHQALSDIAEIRSQLQRTESYRGFRSSAVGISVLVVIAGAWAQHGLIADPAAQVDGFLAVWLVVAVVSILSAGFERWIRYRISQNRLVLQMHRGLIWRIAPSLLVGFVLTALFGSYSYDSLVAGAADSSLLWALPGIWALLYGNGLFACTDHLPKYSNCVAGYFLASGIVVLFLNYQSHSVEPWHMLVTFAVGQFLLGLVLWLMVERDCG